MAPKSSIGATTSKVDSKRKGAVTSHIRGPLFVLGGSMFAKLKLLATDEGHHQK